MREVFHGVQMSAHTGRPYKSRVKYVGMRMSAKSRIAGRGGQVSVCLQNLKKVIGGQFLAWSKSYPVV